MQHCYAHWNESVYIHIYIYICIFFHLKGRSWQILCTEVMCFKNSNPAAVWGVVLKSTENSVTRSVTVLEKHNITPKSIWLGVGFEILRNAMLPFFILLDPIISNLMGMAQTPICIPSKISPRNGTVSFSKRLLYTLLYAISCYGELQTCLLSERQILKGL